MSNGKKKFLWRRGDAWTLAPLAASDLPLYGIDRLVQGGVVVVCEGEKATDALLARHVSAVGTVTGASDCPSRAVLECLRGRVVVLWPDNDAPGARHMAVLCSALSGIASEVRKVSWKDAPPKGDAADFRGDDAALRSLVESATPYTSAAVADEPEKKTELGNGQRIARMFGSELRHTGAVGWHVWDGRRWKADDTDHAMRLAKKAVVSMLDEAKALGATEEAEDLANWAIRSQKKSVLDASLALAASEVGIAVRRTDFDRDPYLLNVENGTLDLRTGELKPHTPSDLITRLCPVRYDPSADCPWWTSFLDRFLPDPEIQAFLQRYLGSCLTGDASDQAIVILYGPGGNGKSTLIETVTRVLGDYFVGTPFSTLTMNRDSGQATNDLAALAGARLVVASEPPEGATLNTATVKHLTGGDTITARHLYREFFSFQPEFKLTLVTNHRPQIEEATHAVWRRVHLVPFSVTITEQDRDESFKERLWQEREGVLKWLIRGCTTWIVQRLDPPSVVKTATDEYKHEEDSFSAFVDERCILDVQDSSTRASALLTAYNSWAKDNGFDSIKAKTLASKLREKGLKSRKSDGCVTWDRIGLKSPPVREDRED